MGKRKLKEKICQQICITMRITMYWARGQNNERDWH